MDNQTDTSIKHIVEGLIFAADEPITPKQLRDLVEGESTNGSPGSSGLTPQKLQALVDELNDDYERYARPYRIQAIAGGYIFATNRDVSVYVGKLHKEQSRKRLTQAALETLSIIAYKQPITKVELETIRGVNSDYIVRSLLEKDLIAIVGREQTPGRPLLYATTDRFLMHFGLNSINELPKPREIEELIGETELEVEKRLLEIQKQKQDEEEEAAKKRERKPHPLSEGATAKIIPLKPDYKPLKKREPEPEEESHKTVEEPEPSTEHVEDKQTSEIEEPEIDETVEQETREEKHEVELEKEPVKESHTGRIPEQTIHEEVQAEREGNGSQRGWKTWKNKITEIIKKIFG